MNSSVSTVALIIPIHPKHFNYIYHLNNNIDIIKGVCDIILVFSSENEYNLFKYKEDFKNIIIPPVETGNIVTYKKFYALETLKDTYTYYIVCDAEIDIIIRNFTFENIIRKINNIYEKKYIYAGFVDQPNINEITRISSNIFTSTNDRNILKHLTLNYKLYYWWSDLPVYKGSHLSDFFSKIDYRHINWNHFDHKIYLNYLVLYHNFKFINITPTINRAWSLENLNDGDINNLEKLKNYSYSFSWITPTLYKKHSEYLTNQGCFILYHLDRH